MKVDKPKSLLSETAYRLILDSLFSKEIPFGSKISQKDLVRITGTAIGPIRDALKVLEADCIVQVHPRSGVEVIKPTTELVRSTFQFRTIIERAAARQFAISASSETIQNLRDQHLATLEKIRRTDKSVDLSKKTEEIEEVFHVGMANSLNNELIDTCFRRLRLMARVIKLSTFVSSRSAEISLLEHLEVLDACVDRDADQAEASIAKHLLNALCRNLGLQ